MTVDPNPSTEPYVLFTLAGTAYAVPSRDVQRMEMVEHVTPVPNSPPFVDGVVFSRGKVVPAGHDGGTRIDTNLHQADLAAGRALSRPSC